MEKLEHYLFVASRVEDGAVFLDKEESRHAFSVLRLSPHGRIRVTDGAGSVYECTVTSRTPAGLSAAIEKSVTVARTSPLVRAVVGLCEKEQFEELCTGLSALGVAEIMPCVCRYSQKPWWNAWEKISPRLIRKMAAGIKQSLNPWLPVCAAPAAFEKSLSLCKESFVLVADPGGEPFGSVFDKIEKAGRVSCFVGPPGGFSTPELDSLKSLGAVFVCISPYRLRTELAAAVLCAAVKMAASAGQKKTGYLNPNNKPSRKTSP